MKKILFLFFALLLVSFLAPVHAEMIILRPNFTIVQATTQVGCTAVNQWDCLDEVTHDSATTAVAITSTTLIAMYDFNDTIDYISGGLPSGARINWVLATGVIRDGTGSAGANNGFLRLNVSSGSARSIYNTSDLNPGAAWQEFNNTNYTTSPKSGVAWTLADVDGLRLGFDGTGDATPPPNTTQLSIKVGYTPVLTANASFNSNGMLRTTNVNNTGVGVLFNGTCNVNGGTSDLALYVQDNSSGSFANTSGTTGALIYVNRTDYNLTGVSDTSGNMFFNITVLDKTAEYGFRIQCSGPNAVPVWANSTANAIPETNLTVLYGIEANASFESGGATKTINTNSSTTFNSTCTIVGGTSAYGLKMYIQDNSSGTFANTTGAIGAFIYTNITAYNVTTDTSGSSGNMYFNVTVTNITAEYGLRVQCTNATIALPSWANSTVETNLSLTVPSADSCTPTANEDWLLNSNDNCRINNKEYIVKKINVTGSGTIFFAKSNITYTALNFIRTARFVFNESFRFARSIT